MPRSRRRASHPRAPERDSVDPRSSHAGVRQRTRSSHGYPDRTVFTTWSPLGSAAFPKPAKPTKSERQPTKLNRVPAESQHLPSKPCVARSSRAGGAPTDQFDGLAVTLTALPTIGNRPPPSNVGHPGAGPRRHDVPSRSPSGPFRRLATSRSISRNTDTRPLLASSYPRIRASCTRSRPPRLARMLRTPRVS